MGIIALCATSPMTCVILDIGGHHHRHRRVRRRRAADRAGRRGDFRPADPGARPDHPLHRRGRRFGHPGGGGRGQGRAQAFSVRPWPRAGSSPPWWTPLNVAGICTHADTAASLTGLSELGCGQRPGRGRPGRESTGCSFRGHPPSRGRAGLPPSTSARSTPSMSFSKARPSFPSGSTSWAARPRPCPGF